MLPLDDADRRDGPIQARRDAPGRPRDLGGAKYGEGRD